MAGLGAEESDVGRNAEIISNEQLTGEALAEWRFSEQVENGTPSTSPPFWDCDDEEDGPKPSELYGKYTWKIEKFSQIKRELRSNAFEIGGYKWYILIYPQGCDVCNHLSLFLCVANHDKLLPGWSHFAQFTIAVVNKDPKKSKYSDTLHRFWKKEHDWGWKKFMELSKVFDGFIDSDTLIIKAQVQVIRVKADRPFRCLDRQYRRELVRVYLSNVEQICRRFVEERRGKLRKLIEDRVRWSSFSAFWLGMNQNSKYCMSREKTDVILKVMVKHFFIEKEVTSTLVMDSFHSGLKALEALNKNERATIFDSEETTVPIVCVEKDTFVLVDDIIVLLGRAAVEPLPPKDEKGPQNRKDGNTGEDFNRDSIERDERHLTELGRRTLEMFVLAHIFSNKIEVAYQEAVALKRQEELIREEEAAWLAESEKKAKCGGKDKKSKKKQAKQKRNNRKGKEKRIEEKPSSVHQNKHQINGNQEDTDFAIEQEHSVLEKRGMPDNVSEASDSVAIEVLEPETGRDGSPVNWDSDTSEVHPPTESRSTASSLSSVLSGIVDKKNPSTVDDSSSTCSTDSILSVVVNGFSEGNVASNCSNPKSHSRGKNHCKKMTYGGSSSTNGTNSKPSGPAKDGGDSNDVSGSYKTSESEFKCLSSEKDGEKCLKLITLKKETISLQKTLLVKDQIDVEGYYDVNTAIQPSQVRSSIKMSSSSVQPKTEFMDTAVLDPVIRKASQSNLHQSNNSASPAIPSQVRAMSKFETQKLATPISVEKAVAEAAPVISRPSSAPLVPAPRAMPATTVVSMVQTAPLLARSMSAAGQLDPDPSPATHSYRNAIIGSTVASNSASHPSSSMPRKNSAPVYSSCPVSASSLVSYSSEKMDHDSIKLGSPFSMSSMRTDPNLIKPRFSHSTLTHDNRQNGSRCFEISQRDASRSIHSGQSFCSKAQDLTMCNTVNNGYQEKVSDILAGTSGRQSQGALVDEFPHLDIINDLLDDEHAAGSTSREGTVFQSSNSLVHLYNSQYSFPGEMDALGDVGCSTSCEVETLSYHDDGCYRRYPLFGGLFDTQDFVPHLGPVTYPNGQVDGMLQNQWHVGGSNVSLFGTRNMEVDIYPQYNPEYSTLACDLNGYPVFPPSNARRK